jgi:hypothetical protein
VPGAALANRERLDRRWAAAWACLAAALGLHVVDEALTGFLPFYNSTIESARASHAWLPFPTFSFPVWIGGLAVLVAALFALTPLVRRGQGWLRPVSYFLGALMILNALGHAAASLWLGRAAPGVYSSPVLLVAAIALLAAALQSRRTAGPSVKRRC